MSLFSPIKDHNLEPGESLTNNVKFFLPLLYSYREKKPAMQFLLGHTNNQTLFPAPQDSFHKLVCTYLRDHTYLPGCFLPKELRHLFLTQLPSMWRLPFS